MKLGRSFKFAAILMAIMLVFSMSFAAIAAETPVLVITGNGIVSGSDVENWGDTVTYEKAYTLEELKALGITEDVIFSAINSSGTKSVFRGEGVDIKALLALSGYTANGTITTIANDGYESALDLSAVRYYYPGFVDGSAADAKEVPYLLAWADGGKRGETVAPAAVAPTDEAMKVMVGQADPADINNPMYGKYVNKLLVGEELSAVLTVNGTEYGRAAVLLMPRTEATYTYSSSSGDKTDKVRGVLLADLLGDTVKDSDILSFTCADGYDVSDLSLTYGEAKAKNYMLAYEKEEDGAMKAIFETAKKDTSIWGLFTLYGVDLKPSKMTDSITSAEGSGEVAPPVDDTPVVTPPAEEKVDYTEAIKYVTDNKLMVGTPKGFEPEATATRATIVTVLQRLAGESYYAASTKFWDVAHNYWYTNSIAWAVDKGIAEGYTDYKFGPNDNVTREQLCVLFANYMRVYGINLPTTPALVQFTDAEQIHDWAADDVQFATSLGLMSGYGDGTFRPCEEATRGDIAIALMNFAKAIEAVDAIPAEQPILLITGQGLMDGIDGVIESSFTLADLQALGLTKQQLYSAVNSSGTKSIFLVEGIMVADLLAAIGYEGDAAISVIAADGYAPKVDYTEARYYFPGLASDSTADAVEVGAMIGWAEGGERGNTSIPTTVAPLEDGLTLYVGQLAIDDKNNSRFTSGVAKVLVGEEFDAVITVAGNEMTRSDILMLPRTTASYTYMTKGGEATDTVRGVMLKDLLAGYDDEDTISFTAADGYDMSSASCTLAEAIAANAMIAYEEKDENGKWVGILDTAKGDASIHGLFTLYMGEERPSSLIDSVGVKKASGIDYATTPFRHITNGGLVGSSPYNIDAITGSTLTIEGPGMQKSIPLSIRELENANAGTVRDVYTDVNGELMYEGIDLYHILYGMTAGDNGIITTDKAYKVTLKNRNRANIGEFTIAQIKEAHDAGRPILVAYGTGFADGSKAAPFVFDGELGSIDGLYNEDGCIKLVYDSSAITGDINEGYDKFLSMAYIYVSEEFTPGFKHDKAPYDNAALAQYILTFKGEGLGREVNLTVEQIEDLVEYDENGNIKEDGLGYRDLYSLTNTTYWYVNEYEGIRLYPLLKYLGVGDEVPMDTKVTFTASDGYKSADSFTLTELADPNLFHYFEKGAEDINDGNYVPKEDDLKYTGYPVLLCYGINSYPYTINTSDEGYLSGLSNNGGPFRIIFGKRDYFHVNGSNQIQFANQVVIGEDTYAYSTHKYSDPQAFDGAYNALAAEKLTINVKGTDGTLLKDNVIYTVGDIEDLIYGDVTELAAKSAQNKAYYQLPKNGAFYSDLYEGIDLEYFLTKVLEIPGIKGSITFTNGEGKTLVVSIEDVLAKGTNPDTGVTGLGSTLAFAKNGVPMVVDKNAKGFEKEYSLGNEDKITIKNDGGPLCVLIPASEGKDAQALTNVVAIDINLEADKYAHLSGDYAALAANTLTISGNGTTLTAPKTFTVGELEGKQTLATTAVYSFLNKKGTTSELRYRGIDLYDFLRSTDVGLRSNAEMVKVTTADGATYEFPVSAMMKKDYVNTVSGAADLSIILAYGSASADADAEAGLPLVIEDADAGYVEANDNAGGPLMLIIPQKDAEDVNKSNCMKNVASIEITASALDSWKHNVSDIYNAHSGYEFILEVTNSDKSDTVSRTFTVADLEAMDSIIIRDDYTWVGDHAHEGIMLWALIEQEFGNVVGIDNPASITALASDGFPKEIVAIWGMEQVQNGIISNATGERKHIIIAYSQNGYPLVPDEGTEGYSGAAQNAYGPLRMITHENQGACMKYLKKVIIVLNGTDKVTFE